MNRPFIWIWALLVSVNSFAETPKLGRGQYGTSGRFCGFAVEPTTDRQKIYIEAMNDPITQVKCRDTGESHVLSYDQVSGDYVGVIGVEKIGADRVEECKPKNGIRYCLSWYYDAKKNLLLKVGDKVKTKMKIHAINQGSFFFQVVSELLNAEESILKAKGGESNSLYRKN